MVQIAISRPHWIGRWTRARMHDTPLFLVCPTPSDGWEVSCMGSTQSHFFSDKDVALSYAKSWAEANRPARVRIETRERKIEAEWVYEAFR